MKNRILIIAFVLTVFVVNAQKMRVKEGNIKNLKGITEYNVTFDYTDVKIPKFDTEEDFLADKMAKREEKKEGDGERFKKSWFDDRPNKYQPKFVESFNKRFDDGAVKVEQDLTDAKYTMKVHTTKLYPGYNVGIIRHNAEIDVVLTVFETANPSNILLSGSYRDVQGYGSMGYDFNSGDRIAECYAKLAKVLAKNIKKKAK